MSRQAILTPAVPGFAKETEDCEVGAHDAIAERFHHRVKKDEFMQNISLLIIEEHAVIRKGLAELLGMIDGFEVVGEAANGEEGVELFSKTQPDVTLMDVCLGSMSSVEVIQRLLLRAPDTQIIVLANYEADDILTRALRAGAQSYILFGLSVEELVSQIRNAHCHKTLLER